ncbi:MAG: dephospho-CoA kinase [Limnochordia bacterium]
MIGLTGGIATGKSTVAQRLRQLGAVVLDADVIAREVVDPRTPGWELVREAFPEVIQADLTIDRKRLGEIIFVDAAARRKLEGIIHPLVIDRMRTLGDVHAKTGQIVICDIPLLYESGSDAWLDEVWVVYTDLETQIKRLMCRSRVSREMALKMINAQMPIDEKVRRADRVIDNSGTFAETYAQVDAIWKEIAGENRLDCPRQEEG